MIILRQKEYSFNTDIPDSIKVDNKIELKKDKLGFIARLLGRLSKKIKESQGNFVYFYILQDNKEVGVIELQKINNSEINGIWLEVDEKHRGNKIATKTLSYLLEMSRKMGFKYFTLEVPGNSPDARHIYEKLGFKEDGIIDDPGNDIMWGGLTKMKLKL